MHQASRIMRFWFVSLFMLASAGVACGGSQKKATHKDDKLVPEETQQRSREQQGKQQMMFDELGMTPSEQAGAHHEAATKPVENPKYSRDEDEEKSE